MKDINPKHKVFADEYIITTDPISSYQKAYPKASSESARVKSYSLLQNVTVSEYIAEAKEKIKNARENNLIETLKKKDTTNILTREKFVEMTSNVAILTYNKFIQTKEGEDAETFSRVAALLAKIEGFESPKKIDQKTTILGLDSEFVD